MGNKNTIGNPMMVNSNNIRLTPSLDLIKDTIIICSQHGVKLVCMLRCRGGNFIYTPLEMDNMLNTLSIWKREGLNLDGVVVSACINDDNTLYRIYY